MAVDEIVFWVFAPISIGSAIAMLLQRNAVHAALFLVVNFFTIAVFYLVLGASFLFAVQIIVYAGAIMVLFLFVIMLLGVDRQEPLVERLRGQRVMAIVLGTGIAIELIVAIRAGIGFATKAPRELRRGRQPWGQRGGARAGAVPGVLLPLRGDVRAPDRRRDRRGGARVAPAPGDHTGRGRERPPAGGGVSTPIAYFVVVSAMLFAIGTVGVLVRKNALVIFMSVELQLNAVNLALVAFSRMHGNLNGQVVAFFSMVVAAAEVVVGLAIIVVVYRRRQSASVDDLTVLRG